MTTITITSAGDATGGHDRSTTRRDEPPPAHSRLDGSFINDLLGSVLAHERCCQHLYRSVAGWTEHPLLRQHYERIGREASHHVAVLVGLVRRLGGEPAHVLASAPAVQTGNAKLVEAISVLSGAVDPVARETAMLDAVFIAESIDRANWRLMARLRDELPVGEARSAFAEAVALAEIDEDEHVEWARTTRERIALLKASRSPVRPVRTTADEMASTIRHWTA